MAFEKKFDPALSLPVNFSVRDNPYENSKQKYPKQMRLFIPLTSIDEFCAHIKAAAADVDFQKPGKVYDMKTGENEEVLGIYLNGNGKKNKFEEDEDSCFGTINPRRIQTEEDSEEIPF